MFSDILILFRAIVFLVTQNSNKLKSVHILSSPSKMVQVDKIVCFEDCPDILPFRRLSVVVLGYDWQYLAPTNTYVYADKKGPQTCCAVS